MTPTERIHAIQVSIRVFVCGLFSLLPVIGLLPAIYAVAEGLRLNARHRGDWNPAAIYLHWGMLLSVCSCGIWFLAAAAVWVQVML